MNSPDELTSLLADFEHFLNEVGTYGLKKAEHQQILTKVHQYLVNLQQKPKQEDKVEKLAKAISQSLLTKIEEIRTADAIEGLKKEIQELGAEKTLIITEIEQLKTIKNKIFTELVNLKVTSDSGNSLKAIPAKDLKPLELTKNQETNKSNNYKIKHLTDLFSEEPDFQSQKLDIWYLGLDFGTLGIAAVLFNASRKQQYPLFWSLMDLDGIITPQFRFPTLIYQSTVKGSFVLGGLNLPEETDIMIDNYKSYFNWSIPNQEELDPLYIIQQLAKKLLLQLHGASVSDLPKEYFRQAFGQLQGVVINFPSSWSDTYRFNLREIILQAHLVVDSGQIFWVEEAIANLLGRFNDPQLLPGWTLVINGGSSTTEIALVNLPQNWQELSYTDFSLETVSYAQHALEQDIFTQFIYPGSLSSIPKITTELPKPGKIEKIKRYQLDQYLQSYPIAHSFLEAAKLISLMLQQEEEFKASLGEYNCQVNRQDLFRHILTPFLEDLAQVLKQLLNQRKIYGYNVQQVICSGGLVFGIKNFLLTWLADKFPKATIIMDTEEQNATLVAQGLAYLPLFPEVLERSRHQYSDYFLLKELLDILPSHPFTIEELMQKLASRGINTRVCTKRILNLLKGQFPPGIINNLSYQGGTSLIIANEKGYYSVDNNLCEYLNEFLPKILSQSVQQFSEPLLVNFSLNHESS